MNSIKKIKPILYCTAFFMLILYFVLDNPYCGLVSCILFFIVHINSLSSLFSGIRNRKK